MVETLSDKIHGNVIHEWEVKESIKRLRMRFIKLPFLFSSDELIDEINKIFGDKLTK